MPDQEVGPTKFKTVPLSSGKSAQIERADVLNVGTPSYAFKQAGDYYQYSFRLDNRQIDGIKLGGGRINLGLKEEKLVESLDDLREPFGWYRSFAGWFLPRRYELNESKMRAAATSQDTLSDHATYVMKSKRKPGLMQLVLSSRHLVTRVPTGVEITEADEQKIIDAENSNARREFVIGPAFPVGITPQDVLKVMKYRWIDDFGFSFLKPLTETATDPKKVLETLKPSTDLEQDILDCLRTFL
jgi:hypothetical protein